MAVIIVFFPLIKIDSVICFRFIRFESPEATFKMILINLNSLVCQGVRNIIVFCSCSLYAKGNIT